VCPQVVSDPDVGSNVPCSLLQIRLISGAFLELSEDQGYQLHLIITVLAKAWA